MLNPVTSAIPVPSEIIEEYALDILNVDPQDVRGTFSSVYQALDDWWARANQGFTNNANSPSIAGGPRGPPIDFPRGAAAARPFIPHEQLQRSRRETPPPGGGDEVGCGRVPCAPPVPAGCLGPDPPYKTEMLDVAGKSEECGVSPSEVDAAPGGGIFLYGPQLPRRPPPGPGGR